MADTKYDNPHTPVSAINIQHSTFNIIKDYEKEQFLGGGAAYCDSRTDSGTDRTGHHLV